MLYPKILYRRWAITLLIAFALALIIFAAKSFTLVHGATAQRMAPIIAAYSAAFGASDLDYDTAWNKADDLLDNLSHDQSRVSDDASAALLCYYLGEHTAEEMLENVAARGPRELPYIEKYRRRRPVLLRVDLDFMLQDSGTCHRLLDEAAKGIKETKK
jgi:hypothetical protein